MADKLDKAEANEANKAKADEAKEANVINEIDAANEANVAEEANVIDEIVVANEADKATVWPKPTSRWLMAALLSLSNIQVSCCTTIPSSFASMCCLNSPSQNIPYLLLK